MSTHSQPENHPILLAIAAVAFVMLMVLGLGLFNSTSEHTTGVHVSEEATETAH